MTTTLPPYFGAHHARRFSICSCIVSFAPNLGTSKIPFYPPHRPNGSIFPTMSVPTCARGSRRHPGFHSSTLCEDTECLVTSNTNLLSPNSRSAHASSETSGQESRSAEDTRRHHRTIGRRHMEAGIDGRSARQGKCEGSLRSFRFRLYSSIGCRHCLQSEGKSLVDLPSVVKWGSQ